MGSLRSASTISGTLDGTGHTLSGTATRKIAGASEQSIQLTTAFTVVTPPQSPRVVRRALIVNTGSTEVKVRIERVAATTWDYFNIPAGRFFEITDDHYTFGHSGNIVSIAVRCMSGTGRAIVHQAWV